MKVWLESEAEHYDINPGRHRRFAEALLNASGEVDSELSILLVDGEKMQQLNHQYRGLNQPTDVLSFSMREGDSIGQNSLLGDIIISVETAEKQAADYGNTLDEEIDELLFHGFLHLLGYDHDQDSESWNQAQKSLLDSVQKHKISYIPKGMELKTKPTKYE